MQCAECETVRAQLARVIFSEDTVDEIPLCKECFREFEASELVTDVTLLGESVDDDNAGCESTTSVDVLGENPPVDEL